MSQYPTFDLNKVERRPFTDPADPQERFDGKITIMVKITDDTLGSSSDGAGGKQVIVTNPKTGECVEAASASAVDSDGNDRSENYFGVVPDGTPQLKEGDFTQVIVADKQEDIDVEGLVGTTGTDEGEGVKLTSTKSRLSAANTAAGDYAIENAVAASEPTTSAGAGKIRAREPMRIRKVS